MKKSKSENNSLHANGMKISELGECLVHASLSSTQKYTHITQKEAMDNYDMAHPRA
jgi:site-specific recombinase XerD